MERFKSVICVDTLFIKDNKVLLMERINTGNDDGYFELPGGHLEENEDLFDAMIREAKEELLIDLSRDYLEIVHVMHHYTGLRLNVIFKCNKDINPSIGEPNKCSKLIWSDINDLPINTTDKVKKIISNINNDKYYDYM